MKKRVHGKITPTQMAPARQTLKAFGGVLTIDEFRKSNHEDVSVKIPGEFSPVEIFSKPVTQKETSLKREKPLERAKSSLEAVLCINRRKK